MYYVYPFFFEIVRQEPYGFLHVFASRGASCEKGAEPPRFTAGSRLVLGACSGTINENVSFPTHFFPPFRAAVPQFFRFVSSQTSFHGLPDRTADFFKRKVLSRKRTNSLKKPVSLKIHRFFPVSETPQVRAKRGRGGSEPVFRRQTKCRLRKPVPETNEVQAPGAHKKIPILVLLLFLLFYNLPAKKLLADLDFSQGNWTLVAVSLHNYKQIPLQKEIGTFKIDDKKILAEMQESWDCEPYYYDYCEHHYALKFYKDKKLMKTLKVNLHCNYITDGLFSYRFPRAFLLRYKSYFRRLPWSQVRFTSLSLLRRALEKIKNAKDVYFYDDYKKYRYDGFFMIGINKQEWNVNRDSLLEKVANYVQRTTGTSNFHIEQYIFYLTDEMKLNFRYFIYCDKRIFDLYKLRSRFWMTKWRSHLDAAGGMLKIVVVGVNKDRYFKLIGIGQ